jgi:hypothetical protein
LAPVKSVGWYTGGFVVNITKQIKQMILLQTTVGIIIQ